jgi:hypothetical protein
MTTQQIPNRRKYRSWANGILPIVKQRLSIFRREGVPPTVRGMLYILESLRVLKKTKSDYNSLSSHLTEWREDGTIAADSFVDKSRRITDINDVFEPPPDYIRHGTSYLLTAVSNYYKAIPRWYGQPHYVEVWLEKNAVEGTFKAILKGREVRIAPNGGWSSFTFANNNLGRLLEKKAEGKIVHVRYYGDSDPSGYRMDEDTGKMVNLLHRHGIRFERIAITDSQIEEFGLQHLKAMTDPKVLQKLRNNVNTQHFRDNHDGEVWQIELDALQLAPAKFKQLVLSDVDQFFDEKIHQRALKEVKDKYPAARIHRLLKKMIAELYQELLDREPEV